MGYVPNHTYSDTPVTPLLSLHETLDKFQSLIPEFTLITVKCPDSTHFSPPISLKLNQSTEPIINTGSTGVAIPNSGPPNNCVVEEIIPQINGHDTDQFNSFWAYFDSEVKLKSDDDIFILIHVFPTPMWLQNQL